jgi:uncharacterized protein YndB with AHSA1/START domain
MSATGTIVHADGTSVIRFERDLAHPPEVVFAALTLPEDLRAWFPCSVEGERREGAPLRFAFDGWPEDDCRSGGNGMAPIDGEYTVYDPPHVLEMLWGDQVLRFELTPTATGTRLVFVHRTDHTPRAGNYGTGWHQCLDALGAHLDGTPTDMRPERWSELAAEYGSG